MCAGPYALKAVLSLASGAEKPRWPGHALLSLGSAGQVFLEPHEGKLLLYRQAELRVARQWEPRAQSERSFTLALLNDKITLEMSWDGKECHARVNGEPWAKLPARGTKAFDSVRVGPFPGMVYMLELRAR